MPLSFLFCQDLASSERQRRKAETERDELQEEISGNLSKGNSLVEDKRRLDQRIATLEDELEEEQSNVEILMEKERKSNAQVGVSRGSRVMSGIK